MPNNRWIQALAGAALFLGVSLSLTFVVFVAGAARDITRELDQVQHLKDDAPPVTSEVFDRRGEKIGEFASERRYFVPLAKLPPHVVRAFLAAEDKDFYRHFGVNPLSIARSALANLRGRALKQGASTITQQLARLYFLDADKNWTRKAKEALLAVAIERKWSKDEILELYLNKIYLGNKSYGLEAAARNYFRKSAADLSVGEAALLAALPKAPTYYAPNKHPDRANRRQAFVLNRMAEDGAITAKDALAWAKYPISVAAAAEDHFSKAPYFIAAVQREFESRFEATELPHDGLKIRTTLDLRMQRAAETTLGATLKDVRKQAVYEHRAKGRIEGALVAIDPRTGGVLAMQGGTDFAQSQFNRSDSSKRRIAGLFLPLCISLALERGFTLASPISADPMTRGAAKSAVDTDPSLFELALHGDVLPAARLFGALGGGTIAEHLSRFGLTLDREDVSVALGYGEATPLEVTRAYSAFANAGRVPTPFVIAAIEDGAGKTLYRAADTTSMSQAVSPQTAFIVNQLLTQILKQDHATPALSMPVAVGGTSTATDDLQNAWHVGVSPNIVSAVWIGAETGQARLAATETEAAAFSARAWAAFIKALPKSYADDARPSPPPPGVTFAPFADGTALPFLSGTEPRSEARHL